MARTKKSPRKLVKELRAQIANLEETNDYLRAANARYQQLANEELDAKQRREAANVNNLTTAIAQTVTTITGRRVKNLTWSWD